MIAIKTGLTDMSQKSHVKYGKSTSVNYLKNLQKNKVYQFYNNYSFPNDDFSEIKCDFKNDINLYHLNLSNKKKVPVNINAIVGENGSGKSSLIDLICWINYNLGSISNLLEDRNGKTYVLDKCIDIQLLYSIDTKKHSILKLKDGFIHQAEFELIDDAVFQINSEVNWRPINLITDLSNFFYSVVINYSQYALNSREIGDWITGLFEKNDSYQTPIVLNPMRHEGNIDINKEKHLLSRRLQANVLEKVGRYPLKESLRNLANGKIAKTLRVSYNTEYFTKVNPGKITDAKSQEISDAIFEVFEIKEPSQNLMWESFLKYVVKYVWIKLRKIVHKYPLYSKFKQSKSIKNVTELLIEIKGDESHITFKIKGAIYFAKYFDLLFSGCNVNYEHNFGMDIAKYSNAIEEIKKREKGSYINTYMMALPSFFNVEVIPEKSILSFETLSSGEKQRIYSLSSIAYHLINLNSVESRKLEKKGNKLTRYSYINLVLDEIEMYYHPEWQRKYISDLLSYLEKINPKSLDKIVGINIIFVTHSPFILSDIPRKNVLLLDGNSSNNSDLAQTFGANIHDLLRHSFFLKDGSMGEFAVNKINETINFLNFQKLKNEIEKLQSENGNKEIIAIKTEEKDELEALIKETDKEKHLALIEIIDEPILKRKLIQLYDEVFMEANEIELINRRIKDLETQKADIQKFKK